MELSAPPKLLCNMGQRQQMRAGNIITLKVRQFLQPYKPRLCLLKLALLRKKQTYNTWFANSKSYKKWKVNFKIGKSIAHR